jgi:16S rRNA (adenine(1408)-N(1))-methyltransferase
MADASRRAAAKPARGGLENVLFIEASLENLGTAFDGLADRLTVNYPWGSLLRGIALPDSALLAKLAALARPGAELDVLVNMSPLRDGAYATRLGLAGAALLGSATDLASSYARAGWTIRGIEDVTGTLVHATRWGSQLHHAGREIQRIRAIRTSG